MAEKTGIEWCDSTANGVMGCNGCEIEKWCYARCLTDRHAGQKGWPRDFFEPTKFNGRVAKAAAWRDLTGTDRPDKPWLDGLPRLVFLDDMGDTFSNEISFQWIRDEIMDNVVRSPHIWLILTKRPKRMAAFFSWWGWLVPWNCWLGTSVTSWATLSRINALRTIPCNVRFVSFEPLLGDVTKPCVMCRRDRGRPARGKTGCGQCGGHGRMLDLSGIHWVIAGGGSGPSAPPMDAQWVRVIRNACLRQGIPFFFKQFGKISNNPDPADPTATANSGSSKGGRMLDGGAWSQMPIVSARRAATAAKAAAT